MGDKCFGEWFLLLLRNSIGKLVMMVVTRMHNHSTLATE